MDQFLFQDLPEEKRVAQLDALCEGSEERDYAVHLTQDELAVRKSKFASLAIQEAKILDRKADAMADFKAELTPVRDEKVKVLGDIKSGTIRETGICYKMIDRVARVVGYYNKRGQLVEQRPMTFDDNQTVLKIAANNQ